MANGTVRLINAVFYAHHGVMQEEHRLGGRYEVDVALEFDFDAAARSDSLHDTVNYETVYRHIKDSVTGERFYLIEKLAYSIAHALLNDFEKVNCVEVTVRKINPPVGGTCDRAEAAYRCGRSG